MAGTHDVERLGKCHRLLGWVYRAWIYREVGLFTFRSRVWWWHLWEMEVCFRVTFFRQLGTIAIWLCRDVNIDSALTWKRSIIRLFQVAIELLGQSLKPAIVSYYASWLRQIDGCEALSDNLMTTSEARDLKPMIGSDLITSHSLLLLMLRLQLSCPMPICDVCPSCTSPEKTSRQVRIVGQAIIEL